MSRPTTQKPNGAIDENFGEILDSEKGAMYYGVILSFVLFTILSTLLTAAFLILSILLWGHFKPNKFFWFLTQLTVSVFLISALNLLINVPATLSLISQEVSQSATFVMISYTIDFFHYSIIFSNLVISIQRLFVFFVRYLTDKFFDPPIIYIWMLLIWLFPFCIEYSFVVSNCKYRYSTAEKKFLMNCEVEGFQSVALFTTPSAGIELIDTILQFILPLIILGIYIALILKIVSMKSSSLNRTELGILKQAIFVFIILQASSLVFLFSRIFHISNVTAFIVKRFVNAMEIFGGAATPCFFFFTSKEIRRLITARVSAASSQGNSNVQVRRQTLQ